MMWPSVGFELNRSSPMAKGLVHWWPPLAAQGNTLYDLAIGGGRNGPFTGNTFLEPDLEVGLASSFDGTGDYIDVGPIPEVSNVAEFTIMAWMRRRSTSIEVPINWSLDNNNRVGLNFWSDANLYFVISSGAFQAGYVAVNDTNWHLNVGRYDGNATGNAGRCRIWVDRVEQTLSFSGTIPATSPDLSAASNGLRIGRSDSFTQEANGWIGDVRIWNRALSVAEIEAFSDNFWALYQPVTRVWPGVAGSSLVRVVNETENVTEVIVRLMTMVRLISATEQVQEGTLRPLTLVRLVTESEQVQEAISYLRAMVRTISEIEQIQEVVNRLKSMIRTVSSTENISEAISNVIGFIRVISETENISEAVLQRMSLVRAVAETIQVVESVVRSRDLVRLIAETTALNESTIAARVMNRVVSETQQIQEAATRLMAMVRAVLESVSVSEVVTAVLGVAKQLTSLFKGMFKGMNK